MGERESKEKIESHLRKQALKKKLADIVGKVAKKQARTKQSAVHMSLMPEGVAGNLAKLDKNKDGKVPVDELIAAGLSEAAAKAFMTTWDTNKDDALDAEELTKFMHSDIKT